MTGLLLVSVMMILLASIFFHDSINNIIIQLYW
jgi:hypothetical protein